MRWEAAVDMVARARDGDQQAWAVLFSRHDPRLVAWLQTMPSGDVSHSAEDLAAETWLVVVAKIRGFSGDERHFVKWLFHIGYQVCASRRRTATRRRTFPLEVGAASEQLWGVTGDVVAEPAGFDSTRHLLLQLSEREAQVVMCLDLLGIDVASTGRALGISDGAVRVAHHRGLRHLRSLLNSPPPM